MTVKTGLAKTGPAGPLATAMWADSVHSSETTDYLTNHQHPKSRMCPFPSVLVRHALAPVGVTLHSTVFQDSSTMPNHSTVLQDSSTMPNHSTVLQDSSTVPNHSTVLQDSSTMPNHSTVLQDSSTMPNHSTVLQDSSTMSNRS